MDDCGSKSARAADTGSLHEKQPLALLIRLFAKPYRSVDWPDALDFGRSELEAALRHDDRFSDVFSEVKFSSADELDIRIVRRGNRDEPTDEERSMAVGIEDHTTLRDIASTFPGIAALFLDISAMRT